MRRIDMPVQVFQPLRALSGYLACATKILPRTVVSRCIGIVHLLEMSVETGFQLECFVTYCAVVRLGVFFDVLAAQVR